MTPFRSLLMMASSEESTIARYHVALPLTRSEPRHFPASLLALSAPQPAAASTTAPGVEEEKKLQIRTEGTLAAAEGGKAPVKVDSEGGVKATESKTRFIGTAVALLVARAGGTTIPCVLRRQAAREAPL
jgi:hypothetical protein